ncbi:hypothetical protein D3C78_1564940 [compost metagenome]
MGFGFGFSTGFGGSTGLGGSGFGGSGSGGGGTGSGAAAGGCGVGSGFFSSWTKFTCMLFGISPWPRLSSLGVGITHTSAPTMAMCMATASPEDFAQPAERFGSSPSSTPSTGAA